MQTNISQKQHCQAERRRLLFQQEIQIFVLLSQDSNFFFFLRFIIDYALLHRHPIAIEKGRGKNSPSSKGGRKMLFSLPTPKEKGQSL